MKVRGNLISGPALLYGIPTVDLHCLITDLMEFQSALSVFEPAITGGMEKRRLNYLEE